MKHIIYLSFIILFILACKSNLKFKDDIKTGFVSSEADTSLTKIEYLGKLLFFEESLSSPPGQACSFCHDPEVGFSNPDKDMPVSKGAHPGHYGSRNDMTVTYSAFIPPLLYNQEEGIWIGGLFWDGRANSLVEQAMGPPLNILEMANPSEDIILEKITALDYATLFSEVFGPDALADPQSAFRNMALAMTAYESSTELRPFSSKYDQWLRGEADLSEEELRGLNIFESEDKGNCIACHPSRISADGSFPLFTDYSYDNLGIPPNPENPFYYLPKELNPDGISFVDLGLGVTVNDPAENGKFRVPTLRNVAVTDPYMHNGVFKTLFQIMAFYNTRDIGPWPAPEVPENVNNEEFGDLGLTNQDLGDLVAFLNTLTDGWIQKP